MANRNDTLLKSTISELAKDPDFVNLPPERQDVLINRVMQDKGSIPHHENFLQRAIKNMGDFGEGFADVETLGLNRVAGGFGTKAANALFPGQPQVSGEEPQTVARGIGQGLAVGRGAQQLVKGGMRILSPKTFARKELPNATGKLSESIQEVFKRSKENPSELGVPKEEVIKVLKEELAKSSVPSGPQGALFKKWINKLEGSSTLTNLTANTISEMESAFGHVAKFGQDIGSNPTLAHGAKVVNRYASGKLDDIATKAGVPEFIANSLKKSKLLSTISKKPSFITKLAKKAFEAGVTVAGGTAGYKFTKGLFD